MPLFDDYALCDACGLEMDQDLYAELWSWCVPCWRAFFGWPRVTPTPRSPDDGNTGR